MRVKTDDKPNGPECAEQIGTLLHNCKVSGIAACTRAGMVYSTLHRWRRGSTPKPGQVDKLRRAIFETALAAGTLPEEFIPQLARLRQTVELPAPETDLAERVARLERKVEEHLGVTL